MYTTELYSATKNEIMNFEGKWVEVGKYNIDMGKQTLCFPSSVDPSFYIFHFLHRSEILKEGRYYNIDTMKVVPGGGYWEKKSLNGVRGGLRKMK